jgi:6-phosphofructo-2-kinase / fructose-2,6-biphosphatase 4
MAVGLPARGKTHLSVSLARYLKWSTFPPPPPASSLTPARLGVKAKVFHLGDYRRQALGSKGLPDDYFWSHATTETQSLRAQILDTCRQDLLDFFDKENGQVGIYDAVNPTSMHRRAWKTTMDQHGIQTIFVESSCDDQEIIEQNVRNVKISSPDVLISPNPSCFSCSCSWGLFRLEG